MIVTYASLCALTESVVTKEQVAGQLCKKLEDAADDEADGKLKNHDKKLEDYRKKVENETGKSIGAADAALLISLSLSL